MANTINFILTNAANELIPKILNGKTLNFTRMAVGDGFSYDTTVARGFKNLVNEVLSIDITKNEILTSSSVRITSAFKNTDVQKEFYYREVGLFAQDPDTGEEVLYAYGNRNDAAELITPTGSNVVTKQLIFIIAVGDSANVTFNVNADVYALQSDMLNVQEKLKQFETGKSNKDLSNTGMITNCLLEVPQRIKYELKDGVLTIKAGTVLIVPYGTVDLSATHTVGSNFLHQNYKVVYTQYDSDGKFFVWVELQEDLIHTTQGILTESGMEFILPEMNWATDWGLESILSGETPPTGNRFFYNTQTNYVEWYDNNKIIHLGFSLPIMITNKENGIPTSITQVFNGMGYIGSTIWVDKGVKGLIPNGINKDGTLANINTGTQELYMVTMDSIFNGPYIMSLTTGPEYSIAELYHKHADYVYRQNEKPQGFDKWWYHVSENQWKYIHENGEIANYWWLDVCICNIKNGIITSLTPFETFNAVNKSSDKQWLSGLGMPSEKYIDLAIDMTTQYHAPANGYYVLKGYSTASGYLALYNTALDIYDARYAPYTGALVTPIIKVRKGDVIMLEGDLVYSNASFRFYYAQGEVN